MYKLPRPLIIILDIKEMKEASLKVFIRNLTIQFKKPMRKCLLNSMIIRGNSSSNDYIPPCFKDGKKPSFDLKTSNAPFNTQRTSTKNTPINLDDKSIDVYTYYTHRPSTTKEMNGSHPSYTSAVTATPYIINKWLYRLKNQC
ncbi:hypothetical protein RF11_02040 [Thelohanellus kitauei]|uniref:Uncharacterized protein n=1 Tax=Thelohanellus kitauei TaxID=669202 RepID=A0A0C2JJI7_THEKT|nr:hypothetical protein RF11_02040 [Thelohanellus kitauei]